jgi:ABC-type antimicrobial peptide transport system permease subunit
MRRTLFASLIIAFAVGGTMVLRQTMRLALIGIALGLVVALAVNRFMESLLFGVQANDPLTFIGVCVVLVAVAALAGYLPARRAANVDPLESLRAD